MEFDLIQSALFTVVIILGLIFWATWVWWKIGDLENKIGDLEKKNCDLMLSEKGMAEQLKIWECEKAVWDREKALMEAERKGWGEEKKKLEYAAGEGAAMKVEYERRVRSVVRWGVERRSRGARSCGSLFDKADELESWGTSEARAAVSLSESSFDAEKDVKGSVKSQGSFDAERDVKGSVTSQGSSYARGVDCVSREVVKAAELAKDAAEKGEKAALAAKDAAEGRAEAAEARVKELAEAAEAAEARAEAAEAAKKELVVSVNGWMVLWLQKVRECNALIEREGEYEATLRVLGEKLCELEETVMVLGEKIQQRE